MSEWWAAIGKPFADVRCVAFLLCCEVVVSRMKTMMEAD